MVDRKVIYKKFVEYVNSNIQILTGKRQYYNDYLQIANNKLTIYYDAILQNKEVFEAIYLTSITSINNAGHSIVFQNSVNVDNPIFRNNIVLKLAAKNIKIDSSIISLMKALTDNYLACYKDIKNIKRQLQLIDDKLEFIYKYKGLSKNVVYYILSNINKYYERAILNGEAISLGDILGTIKVTPKKVKNKNDWKSSFIFRDQLIQEGKVPYNAKDAEECAKNNIPYNGIKWFVYYTDDVRYYINWYKYSTKLPNKEYYTFKPLTHKINTSNIIDNISNPEDVFNYKLGIVERLNILLATNENQFLKYQKI